MKQLHIAFGCLLGALLTGCAAQPGAPGEHNSPGQDEFLVGVARPAVDLCDGGLNTEHQLVLNLVDELIDEARLHAALANLEQLPDVSPEVRLYKARVKRLLGLPEAEALYQGLVDTCARASSYHGLGQLEAARGQYLQARRYLREAARLRPTDQAVRNDLGYVLLHLRELETARFELLTALELDEQLPLPVDNLLTLLIYEGKWREADTLARRSRASPAQLQRAEQRARQMQLEDSLESAPSISIESLTHRRL